MEFVGIKSGPMSVICNPYALRDRKMEILNETVI